MRFLVGALNCTRKIVTFSFSFDFLKEKLNQYFDQKRTKYPLKIVLPLQTVNLILFFFDKRQTQYPLNVPHALADCLKYFILKLGVSDEIDSMPVN